VYTGLLLPLVELPAVVVFVPLLACVVAVVFFVPVIPPLELAAVVVFVPLLAVVFFVPVIPPLELAAVVVFAPLLAVVFFAPVIPPLELAAVVVFVPALDTELLLDTEPLEGTFLEGTALEDAPLPWDCDCPPRGVSRATLAAGWACRAGAEPPCGLGLLFWFPANAGTRSNVVRHMSSFFIIASFSHGNRHWRSMPGRQAQSTIRSLCLSAQCNPAMWPRAAKRSGIQATIGDNRATNATVVATSGR
jgi:hypothetical protein